MCYLFGDYELDEQLYELRRAGEPVELERKVYDVLAHLVQQSGIALRVGVEEAERG